jgi:AcrR family transcriptional regulator
MGERSADMGERSADMGERSADMGEQSSAPVSGRRAQAARNDQRILEAAREVFVADPGAPIAAVAERAGVGIGALYRRYASKEDLLRKLAADGLERYIAAAEAALADPGDPWAVFAEFMGRIVEEDTHSFTSRLAGTFEPTEELHRRSDHGQQLNVRLLERAQQAGVVRPDLTVDDLTFLFEQLASVRVADESRTRQLRRRYLALLLDAVHTPSSVPLPGPAPSWEEVRERWQSAPSGNTRGAG